MKKLQDIKNSLKVLFKIRIKQKECFIVIFLAMLPLEGYFKLTEKKKADVIENAIKLILMLL